LQIDVESLSPFFPSWRGGAKLVFYSAFEVILRGVMMATDFSMGRIGGGQMDAA
jgi:hypothetical protein